MLDTARGVGDSSRVEGGVVASELRAAPVPPPDAGGRRARLVDLLCGLTMVDDLAMGHPPGGSLRSALVAVGLARRLELDDDVAAACFYTALLQHVGCTAYAHEAGVLLGDDLAVNRAGSRTDFTRPSELLTTFLPELTRGTSPAQRLRVAAMALLKGAEFGRGSEAATCEVAAAMADRLGLDPVVQTSLRQAFELWSGDGGPDGIGGDDLTLPIRVTHVASTAVLFHGLGGAEAALEAIRRRSGRSLDPSLAAVFERDGADLLADVTTGDTAEAALAGEPTPVRWLSGAQLVEAARAFGDVVDLKSPYLHGHATGVGDLAQAAGEHLGLAEAADGSLRLAGYLHDVGRAAISSRVWDTAGPLSSAGHEQVRLHAYHSERIVSRSPALAALAPMIGAHHERGDGSGYHRGTAMTTLTMASRVLAAADVAAALTADRPHRSALSPDAAADVLAAEARGGRLDADAVDAVLAVTGHPRPHPGRAWPASLTDRQVEVLRLLATGHSNRQIADALVISPRTAEHHVQAIYAKAGVSNRAAAAMFAMRHRLLEPSG